MKWYTRIQNTDYGNEQHVTRVKHIAHLCITTTLKLDLQIVFILA